MNSRIKFLIASIMFLSVGTFCISTFRAKAKQPKTEVPIQGQERLVMDKSRSDAPVKITLIKTKKRVVDNNKKFLDDDDWLQGLTLRVLNRSDKTVTYVGIQLIFRRTEDQESGLPAGWPINYGFDPFRLDPGDSIPPPQVTPILAGTETEIRLSESEYEEVKKFFAEIGFPAIRKRMEMDIIKIGFSDGTAWNNGLMFRRDPSSQGPLKGWSLLDLPGNGRMQLERRKGSANRTAFFKKASFRSDSNSNWQLPRSFQLLTLGPEDVPCGTVIYESVTCGNLPGYTCHNDQADFFPNPISPRETLQPVHCRC